MRNPDINVVTISNVLMDFSIFLSYSTESFQRSQALSHNLYSTSISSNEINNLK